MNDVDVAIVAHNAGDLLEAAVASVLPDVPEDQVFIADTETTDGSIDRVRARHPRVRYTYVGPHGCSAGNNAAIALGHAPYVLLLNPDAEARPHAIERMRAYMEAHPRVGMVGATILNPDGSTQANAWGRFPSLLTALGLRVWRFWQRLRGNEKLSPRRFERPTPVDWTTGAGVLVRRAAIDQVGAMDAGFYLYFEDTEWCHRMRDHGWEVVVEPSAEIVHHLGKAGGGSSPEAMAAYRVSFFRYCRMYHLWGLAAFARVGIALRTLLGGRS